MKEYGKYIVISSIIGASIIIGAFIMKPDRSAKDDCYYERKKIEIESGKIPAGASNIARQACGIK